MPRGSPKHKFSFTALQDGNMQNSNRIPQETYVSNSMHIQMEERLSYLGNQQTAGYALGLVEFSALDKLRFNGIEMFAGVIKSRYLRFALKRKYLV
ncbi:hypothetical protein CDAR_383211 [Caerostris darwini]|uniref:Uncharacterized protein n=1 Tax=Caerostris darwini TaxID=1538125 RepID=A0AAV4NX19_9ARAC|nr:hypothetical protein CDAR_383211 [Caerostris darwini]